MKTADAFLLTLQPESDTLLGGICSTALGLGIALCLWFSSMEFLTPDILFASPETPMSAVTVKLPVPEKRKPAEARPEAKARPQSSPRPNSGQRQASQGQGSRVPRPVVRLNLLTSLQAGSRHSAYETLKHTSIHQDIDKVMRNAPALVKDGHTQLGERRGRATGGFDGSYTEGTANGISDVIGGLLGGPASALATSAKGSRLMPPRLDQIDMGSGPSLRSASDIMAIVRARTPGLRHIYNQHLKRYTGLSGKISVRFVILPSGDLVSCELIDNSTGNAEFAQAILEAIGRWHFSAVRSGNTTVSLPFAFSE